MSPRAEGIEVCVLALYCVPVDQCWELAFDTAAAERGGNGKMYRCEMARGGLQPQERAPQKRLVWMENGNTGFIKVEPIIAQTKEV